MESGCSSFQLNMMRMVMKMAAVFTITLLLLCSSAIVSTDSQADCKYAATNENFTVILQHELKLLESLTWKHNEDTIFRRKPNGYITGSEKDIFENGSLKLTNLKKEHAGKYTPEVFDKDGITKNFDSIHLCILDRVTKPKVEFKCSSQKTHVTFTCSAQTKDLTIKWLRGDKLMAGKDGSTLKLTSDEVGKESFTCNVSNRASFMLSAPVQQNCIKSESAFPDELFGINIWILVGGGAGVVLMLIVIVICCCIWARRKRRMQPKEEEELRLGWTDPNQQQQQQHQHNHPPDQHHHHHRHQQQQPAGHTGPRQHRAKQHRDQQRARAPEPANGHPLPSPRRPAQAPKPVDNDDEQPPPLPQPRKKAAKTPRM